MYPVPIISYEHYKVPFDNGLFRALCIRNLNGNVSVEDLIEYANGYSLRRYTI